MFATDTAHGATTFAQLATRVSNLEAKLAARIAAGGEARHLRSTELALADARRDLENAL